MLLNDLIKISGRIADLAPCLCDEDKNISILARGFFTEISKKVIKKQIKNNFVIHFSITFFITLCQILFQNLLLIVN